MHTRETIYKRTNSGKVQIWYGQLEDNKFRTVSGQEDGKKVTSEWTACEGKNIGKTNETTPEQQAANELDAMYTKRLEREYRRDKSQIDNKFYTKPMKAIKWYEDAKKRPKKGERIAVQPKLDGMRAMASANGIKSQDGKIIPGAPHIDEALQELFSIFPDIELDGELYNHNYKEDFEGLMSALKKEPETDAQREHARKVVQYHIYDIASHKGPYSSPDGTGRYESLETIFNDFLKKYDNYGYFHFVKTEFVIMDDDGSVVEEIDDSNIEAGYEGSMVRVCSSLYEQKRINGLLKVKLFIDDEFQIVEVLEGKGNWAGHAKALRVLLPNGNICKAGMKGSKAEGKDLWERREELIGKLATIKYLRYSKKGMLNLPIFKSVRWDV